MLLFYIFQIIKIPLNKAFLKQKKNAYHTFDTTFIYTKTVANKSIEIENIENEKNKCYR